MSVYQKHIWKWFTQWQEKHSMSPESIFIRQLIKSEEQDQTQIWLVCVSAREWKCPQSNLRRAVSEMTAGHYTLPGSPNISGKAIWKAATETNHKRGPFSKPHISRQILQKVTNVVQIRFKPPGFESLNHTLPQPPLLLRLNQWVSIAPSLCICLSLSISLYYNPPSYHFSAGSFHIIIFRQDLYT